MDGYFYTLTKGVLHIMKKFTKRLFMGFLTLATLLTAMPVSKVQASSKSTVRLQKHAEYGYEFDDSYPAPFNYKSGRQSWWTFHMNQNNSGLEKLVYCIQFSIPCNTGDQYNHQTTHPEIDAKKQKLLQRALLYGYNENTGALYGGNWVDNAMATQTMVWVITGNQYGTSLEKRIVDNLLQDNPTARGIYDKLRANMESYSTIPSFTATTADKATDYEMKYNMDTGRFERTLEDKSDVLKYFDFSASGVSVQRTGKKLVLSANTANQFETITLKANKNLPKDTLPTLVSGSPEYWLNPTQQNFTSLDVGGSRENVPAYLKLHTEKIGHIKLKKTSEDGIVSGIDFQIKGNGIDRTYKTDKDGAIHIENLVAGEYIITEKAPNRYVQPQSQVVTVKPAQTTAVSFSNVLKKFHIYITKTDSETGSTPQGDATLDGAEYDIYNHEGNFVEHIKADGNTAKSSLLNLGTYKIYEVKPPKGYTLSTEPMTVTGDFDRQSVEVGRADTGISDRVIKGQVAVVKFADAPLTGDAEDGGVKQPLEGIEFTLTLKSTGEEVAKIVTDTDGYAITPLLPFGLYRIEETVGKDGYRKIEPFDIKIASNGKIYKYILENKVYETDVKIVKKDAETGRVIPLAGTQFKIKDSDGNWVTQKYNYPSPATIDTFATASDGTLVLPESLRAGKYELYEVKAPHGYTLSKEPIAFEVNSDNASALLEVTCSNKPVKGTISVEKQGEQFIGSDFIGTEQGVLFTPVYEMQGLADVVFDIVAVEDITTPDGTVRVEKGTVVDTITTGIDGKATSKELYLGKYQLIEKTTVNSFVLSTTAYPAELTYKDQNTEVVATSQRIENERQKAKISLFKDAETICNQTYNPLPDITFGLYARKDILTASGAVGIEKDSLLNVIHLDDAGNGVFTADLPAGDYYVRELSTGTAYILDKSEYDFTFQHMGQEVKEITIQINDGKPIKNSLMRGAISIMKTSEDDVIEGIRFKVTGMTEIGTAYEEIFTTDKDGMIHIDRLLTGTYEVSEVVDDKTIGYITPERQTVTVQNDETAELTFENKLIRGGFKVLKTDENGDPLSGVKFGLYNAEGEQLQEFTTAKDGTYSMDDLLYDDYYIKELETVKGFKLDEDTVYGFTVREHGAIVEIKVINERLPEAPKKTDAPKTGDTTNALALAGLTVLSGAGIAFTAYKKRQGKKKDAE